MLVGVVGIGVSPSVIMLVFFGSLPILRNVLVGLTGVDQTLVESARGMGMSRLATLVRLELPLAWPVIMTGIRVSAQMLMGTAAIAAFALGPGLGGYIFSGISRMGGANATNSVIAGTVGILILAVILDSVLNVVTRLTTPRGSVSDATENATITGGARILLDGVTKLYDGKSTPAVDNVTMEIPAGETVMFVGPSGCGKTTTMKMINRLIEPTSGRIFIGDEDVTDKNPDELRRHIGYVIQGAGLFPHFTVGDNIAIVPKLLNWDKQRIDERVDELLDLVNLDPAQYRNRYPRELSGGQQQRVGVARALAADPPVLLMDEPFGAVDPITRQRLQDELLRLQEELSKTIVFVTHDFDEAVKLGDRIAILREDRRSSNTTLPR